MRLLFFAALLLAVPAAAQVAPVVPRDDGADDPSFVTFRGRLLEALAARDTAAVLSAFAADARLSFGDAPPGPEGVRSVWLSGPRYDGHRLWPTLARVVGMGSIRSREGVLTAPYTYDGPPEHLDAFTHGTIVGENVVVRAGPSTASEAIGTLTYVVVPVVEWGYSEDPAARLWHRVRLDDGREGYVAGEYLWSPVDFRAGFERRDGRWQIVFFVAGD
ncbi:MAG: SH3 domain-containing protein [Rubricoccaceae bacterium]|nr:SH3 domain-containing protein [Rubricoccaceae bacterium]